MKTLELKHLAPYLPYGLDLVVIEFGIEKMIGFINNEVITTEDNADLSMVKPILRPLSELTIEDARGHNYPDEGHLERSLLSGHAPYEVWNEFVKEHFDVFGLIEKGLAIDINTLPK